MGRIEGSIFDELRRPLRGAMIIIVVSPDDQAEIANISDIEGAFRFERLTPGKYRLRVLAEGFVIFQHDLEVERGKTSALEVKMTPLPS